MAKEPGFSGMHKIKPYCFGNIEKKRITENRAMESNRKQQRASTFNCNRNITDGDGQESNSNQERKCSPQADRKVLLAKWKEERTLLKNKFKEKKKPLFKVGIVHHNIASPVFRDISNEKSVTKDKNVVNTLPKKRNNSTSKIKKNVAESSTCKNNKKISVFNKTTLSTGNVLVKPTALKNNVSPVNIFPFNKQKYAFSFRPVSNKKLTEPHSPSFMHSRVKRTQMNQKPLRMKPLFLTAKDNEDKDESQLAHKLPDNSSVHEQKWEIASRDHDREQSTNGNDKPLFLTTKDKEIHEEQRAHRLPDNSSVQEQRCETSNYDHDREQRINENDKPLFLTSKDKEMAKEQLAHRSLDISSVQEQRYATSSYDHDREQIKCTVSSCNQIRELIPTENAESLGLNFVSSENKEPFHDSKSEEIKEESNEYNRNNKENKNILLVQDTQRGKHTTGNDDSNRSNKENIDIQTVSSVYGERSAGELGNNSTEVELLSSVNCSDTTNNENFEISPYITVHRGKRRSRGWRRSVNAGMPDITDACRIKSPNSDINESSKFHRNQLDQETGRLLSLADDWEKIVFEEAIPSSIADEIAGIVGQTRLLTRDKFQQFRSLIEQFENNDGPVKITKDDLAGFWEMMYLQVEKLNKSYSRLEEIKNNKWQEKPAVPIKRRKTVVKTNKPVAKSRFRDFLQGKKMSESRSENSLHTETSEHTETAVSPVTSACTPSSVPIKQVISSECVKRCSASFSPAAYVAMNSSLLGKALGHSPAIIVHNAEERATPKSILKRKLSQSIMHRKKTVLFGEDLMPCDVKSESDSECEDVRNQSSSNDAVINANDQVTTTNALSKTEDVRSAAASSSNDSVITTDDQVVTTNDPAVTFNNPLTNNLNTPRRSSRLASKVASSSSKVPFSTTSSYTDDNSTVTIQNSESAPEKPVKKFTLKPSSLSINPDELIKSNVEKVQKSKNKRSVKNKCEQLEVVDDCITESCESASESSINTRRSKRLLQKESDVHRTVTFESGFNERSASHYRKTPYKKRCRKSFSTEDE